MLEEVIYELEDELSLRNGNVLNVMMSVRACRDKCMSRGHVETNVELAKDMTERTKEVVDEEERINERSRIGGQDHCGGGRVCTLECVESGSSKAKREKTEK